MLHLLPDRQQAISHIDHDTPLAPSRSALLNLAANGLKNHRYQKTIPHHHTYPPHP
ncbi:hypothetical protein DSUL_20327 [Desulfovibrionales bacterium]